MRYPIRTKLILSYLLIVFFVLGVSGGLFYALVKNSVTQQAFDTLEREEQPFFRTLEDNNRQQKKLMLNLVSRETNVYYALVNLKSDQRVLATDVMKIPVGAKFPIALGNLQVGDTFRVVRPMNGKQFLVFATVLPKAPGQALVLMAPADVVGDVMKDLLSTLVKGFLISAAIVLVFGFWLSSSLTKPVKLLGQQMRRLAKRDFTPPPVLQTGDELEEVSRTFSSMVKELKRYDEGQRRFLQNASHELKTPLMAIQGYAEGIKDGIFSGEEADAGLLVIIQESTRLKKLVEELIYLSKLETLEDVYNASEQEFTEIARDSLARVHSLAAQKGIRLSMRGEGAYRVFVDRDKMMQTLINLLSNGIRHAASVVEVILERSGPRLHVTIRDDGEGFTGPQEQIFERFYKGDKGDTGLGLAIVKAIVEKSGGTIVAQNGQQGGAEFHLHLPLHKNG